MTSPVLDVSNLKSLEQRAGGVGQAEFPIVLECQTASAQLADSLQWIQSERERLIATAERSGAILFRSFPVFSAPDFDRFVAAFNLENFAYQRSLSNAVRINYTPRVFSANEAPADVTIYLHHEMAQTPIFPSKIFFCCVEPASEGGATPLCRSDRLFDAMLERCPDFARDCELKGLQYSNVMPAENDALSGMGRSWQNTLRATTREEASARLQEFGYTWRWLDDGCLRATTPVLPAVRQLESGKKVFFNQLIAAFQGWKDSRNDPTKSITFGDRSVLDRHTVSLVAELAEELSFDLQWQPGDVALLDNLLVMHGRRCFQGTRKVLASLVDAQDAFATRSSSACLSP